MNLRLADTPPSLLFFVAGVAASAAVNLVTGLISDEQARTWAILACALPWAVCAGALMYGGALIEAAHREGDLVTDAEMTRDERRDLYRDAVDRFIGSRRLVLVFSVATFSTVGGVVCAIVVM